MLWQGGVLRREWVGDLWYVIYDERTALGSTGSESVENTTRSLQEGDLIVIRRFCDNEMLSTVTNTTRHTQPHLPDTEMFFLSFVLERILNNENVTYIAVILSVSGHNQVRIKVTTRKHRILRA